jgi:PAS domain S-box-containing protein
MDGKNLMKFNLTLSQKGLALVFVPLFVQLVLFTAQAWLHAQAEDEAVKAYRADKIATSVNKLVRHVFDIASLSQGEVSQIADRDFETYAGKIKQDMNDLQEAVKDDPDKTAIVEKSARASEDAYNMLGTLNSVYKTDGPFVAFERLKSVRSDLRFCVKQMVSPELISMAQDEENFQARNPEIQARFRERIKTLLTASLLSSIALSAFIAVWFYGGIVKRLKIMVDNIYRYASRRALNPVLADPFGGRDEISELDRTFHRMTYALAEGEQREKNLVEYSLDAICSIDEGLRFRTVNPACDKVFGFSTNELLGRSVSDVLTEEDRQSITRLLYRTIIDTTKAEFETRISHKDGKVIEMLWSVQFVQDKKLLFCVVHDISRRKEAEKMRQEVVAMVSHDLRTPMATISSYFEMLAMGMFGALSERGMHLLKVAQSNIARMVNLANDLLDIEKSKAGMLTVNCADVELNELLDKSVESVASLASNQEVNLEMKETNLSIFADSNRITQVLVNLLSNAIKFSPKQGVIKIKAEEKNSMAYVYVSDQGRGVPEHLKQTIFERFQQVEIADAADKGGSGLGLAICKAIIELHGGEIKVEDNADKGSTFSFSVALSDRAKNC